MFTKAIEKIKDEMKKNNNPYVQVVGEFLITYLNEDPSAAEKILLEGKTIIKSLDEMKKAAEKKKVGNCAVLTDSEGFAIVLKYFGIEPKISDKSHIAKETTVHDSGITKNATIDFDVKLEDFLV